MEIKTNYNVESILKENQLQTEEYFLLYSSNEIEKKIEEEIDNILSRCYEFYMNIEATFKNNIIIKKTDLNEENELCYNYRIEVEIFNQKVITYIIYKLDKLLCEKNGERI